VNVRFLAVPGRQQKESSDSSLSRQLGKGA
jgi:hypothetical protein